MSAPTVELWQTEWCPASHRVRQRLTELGLTFTVHQVPAEPDERSELGAVPPPRGGSVEIRSVT